MFLRFVLRVKIMSQSFAEFSATINKIQISSQYTEYLNMFFENKVNTLSEHDSHDHVIDTNDKKSLFNSI